MKKISVVLVFFLLFGFISSASAHMLWLTPNKYNVKKGSLVRVTIGWGHHFPKGEKMKKGVLNSMYALSPSGKKIPLKITGTGYSVFKAIEQGSYLIAANIKPGFMTKTRDGRRLHNKIGIKNALSCFRFDIRGKTMVSVGNVMKGFNNKGKQPLEICIERDTGSIKKGAMVPVKVLFNGKPLAGVVLTGLCSSQAGTVDNENSIDVLTDSKGEAQIRVNRTGLWILFAVHKFPYKDLKVCDDYRYVSTMTFHVKP